MYNGLTVDQAHEMDEEFCAYNFSGHQENVYTYQYEHNQTENINVYIVINILRIENVMLLLHMDRQVNRKAGCKYHCTDATINYHKAEVMEMCYQENIYQIDLLHSSKE